MPEIVLAGCTPEPLMNYLKALGVFRIVAEQVDWAATMSWSCDIARLNTDVTEEKVLEFFVDEYQPTPIVSPWNGGSGFYRTWDDKTNRFRSREAVERVCFIEQSGTERLKPYREVIVQVRQALSAYASLINLRAMPKKERKATLLMDESHGILDARQPGLLPYLRATLPDATVRWLDTVLLLQAENTRAAPLFISGGNDGNFDFSVAYMGSLQELMSNRDASHARLASALFASALVPTERGTAGHFNPGGLGGPNGGQGFSGSGGVNPWDFVLMVEGALFLAGAVARRYGIDSGDRAAFSFCVQPVAVGFGSAASIDETSEGCRTELWLPIWPKYATLPELHYLFAEGRAQVGRRQARNSVEFALATCLLGVNRGIDSFVRFGFLRRFGKMFLAAPLGRVQVTPRPEAQLLDDPPFTTWLLRLRSACRDKDKTPGRYQSALGSIDRWMYEFATRAQIDPTADRKALLNVLRAVGRAERTLATGLAFCADNNLRPLQGLSAQWLDQANDGSREYQLAAAVAGIRGVKDTDIGPLRMHLEPVAISRGGRYEWDAGSTSAVWSNRPLVDNLAAIFRRRQLEAFRDGLPGVPLDAPRPARLDAVLAFLDDEIDHEKLHDLIWGLSAVDWPLGGVAPEPAHELAVPFEFGVPRLLVEPLPLSAEGNRWRLVGDEMTKPDAEVFHALTSGRKDAVGECLNRAARRLKSLGRPVVGHRNRQQAGNSLAILSPISPARLLAACLFPLSRRDLEMVANAVLYPPETQE